MIDEIKPMYNADEDGPNYTLNGEPVYVLTEEEYDEEYSEGRWSGIALTSVVAVAVGFSIYQFKIKPEFEESANRTDKTAYTRGFCHGFDRGNIEAIKRNATPSIFFGVKPLHHAFSLKDGSHHECNPEQRSHPTPPSELKRYYPEQNLTFNNLGRLNSFYPDTKLTFSNSN